MNCWFRRFVGLSFLLFCLVSNQVAVAEQMIRSGEYEVHYIVFPTADLNTSVANKYDLPRGKDRALVNISVLKAPQPDEPATSINAVKASVTGSSENLLGQRQTLTFAEITEGAAIYYLAVLRHADEEYHRVAINVTLPNGSVAELKFQQLMYWDR